MPSTNGTLSPQSTITSTRKPCPRKSSNPPFWASTTSSTAADSVTSNRHPTTPESFQNPTTGPFSKISARDSRPSSGTRPQTLSERAPPPRPHPGNWRQARPPSVPKWDFRDRRPGFAFMFFSKFGTLTSSPSFFSIPAGPQTGSSRQGFIRLRPSKTKQNRNPPRKNANWQSNSSTPPPQPSDGASGATPKSGKVESSQTETPSSEIWPWSTTTRHSTQKSFKNCPSRHSSVPTTRNQKRNGWDPRIGSRIKRS